MPGIDAIDPFTIHPLPGRDLNGDAAPDVLVTASHSFFDLNRNRTNVQRPGRLFTPLQAISGATGERLWFAQDIPDPVRGNHGYLHIRTYSPVCEDLDGDGTPEVLCPFSCFQIHVPSGLRPPSSVGPKRQLGFARFSGADGTLHWTQMIEDQITLTKAQGGIAYDAFTPSVATTVVDLNADDVRDPIITAPIHEDHSVQIQALDGRDGSRLWQRTLARKWTPNNFPNESPEPLSGDIDGDERPDVVILDDLGPSTDGLLTYQVTTIDGQSGAVKWAWQYKDSGNWRRPRMVLADLDGDGVQSVCVGLHESSPMTEIVVLGPDGQVQQRFDSGGRVVNNYAESTAQIRIRAADVDGDGKDEFVYITNKKIRASRGGNAAILWEWPLPAGDGGILEIRPGERGQPATIVVEAAGESTIDSWGKSHLASLPPQQGMGARGDSIYGLDGATGKPIWRGRRDTSGVSSVPPVPRLELSQDSPSRLQLPAIVNRSDDRTTAQLVLPTNEFGHHQSPSVFSSISSPPAADPRLMRELPWGPRGAEVADMLALPIMALCSVVFLVIPAWTLRGVLRRRTTMRNLLLLPVAIAAAVVGFQFIMGLPDHKGGVPPDGPVFMRLLLPTLGGVPLLAFPSLLVVWTIRRHWSKLAGLLGASVVLALLIPCIGIWLDGPSMDPGEHYSLNGWYLFLIMGSYGSTLLALAVMILARIAGTLQSLKGHTAPV